MAKRKAIDDGHKMGLRCGYTLMADGRIEPAPMYVDTFAELATERNGINDLMKLFTAHCADLLTKISRRQTTLWDSICEDYGLNKETHDIYFDGKYITAKPKKPPDPSAAP